MTERRIHAIDPGSMPGLSRVGRELLEGKLELPTASPRLRDLDGVQAAAGPLWSQAEFQEELHARHVALGADTDSLESISALAEGAACVVTGQQPAVLLGPLYTAYKILGAIALAEELQRRSGRRTVPVYWCGSDDSDFEEVRRAWVWLRGQGPLRAELPSAAWSAGQQVGGIGGDHLARIELEALSRIDGDGRPESVLRSIAGLGNLGDRAAAWALHLFAGRGLVVVDARSPALRRAARPVFAAYRERRAAIAEAVQARSLENRGRGWPTPLDDRAVESGLFRVDGDRRRKLDPAELARDDLDLNAVTPSVLLRPVVQDALLAPAAAVLGPSELLYHAQIAPVYEALGVQGARPAPRPHAVLWPADLPWLEPSPPHAQWLEGGSRAIEAWTEARLPAEDEQVLDRATRSVHSVLEEIGRASADAALQRRIAQVSGRWESDLADLRRALGRARASRDGFDPVSVARWLDVHGRPQERALSATTFWWWWGDEADAVLDELSARYARAIDTGTSPTWALHGGGPW